MGCKHSHTVHVRRYSLIPFLPIHSYCSSIKRSDMSSFLPVFIWRMLGLMVLLVSICHTQDIGDPGHRVMTLTSEQRGSVGHTAGSGRSLPCVPDYDYCLCYDVHYRNPNTTVYMKVQCNVVGVDFDYLMEAIPPAKLIHLTCPFDRSGHNLTAETLAKHANSLQRLQLTFCSLEEIDVDTFSTTTSLRMVDIFYASLRPKNLPAFGEITNYIGNRTVTIHLQTNKLTTLPGFAFGRECNKNISSLSLNSNNMETVAPRAFWGLSKMKGLYLNNNDISVVHNETFEGCHSLEKLDLHHNNITVVEEGAFAPLSSLRVLDLQSNRLRSLDAGAFRGMGLLQFLNLSYNSLGSLPDGIFDDLTSLKELHLECNSLLAFDSRAVGSPLGHLAFFNISHNSLRDVKPHLLQTKMRKLVRVDFSFNNLRMLRAGAVYNLPLLQEINFRNNSLSQLEWLAFAFTPKLILVDFRFNDFSLVPEKFIDYFIVEVQRETIRTFASGNPFSCGCLLSLWLKQNAKNLGPVELVDIEEFVCEAPSFVKGKHFMQVEKESFWCPLESCVIEGCHCFNRTIDNAPIIICSEEVAMADFGELPVTMVTFECLGCLVNTGISSIPSDSFAGLSHLESLKLIGNNLTFIIQGTFSDLSSLQLLSLGNNQLYEIDSDEMKSLVVLKTVDFHGNRLHHMGPDVFASSRGLQSIDLSDNNLAGLPEGLFNTTDNLQLLRLYGNPLVCNCSLLWLKHWIQLNFRIVEQLEHVLCVTNETDLWTPVVQVPDEDFGCTNSSDVITKVVLKSNVIALSVTSSVVFVFFVVTLVAVRYRFTIRVLLYTRLGFHWFHSLEDENEDEFVYDSYLAYSDENIKEAINVIGPRLEERAPPYTLCLRHRDFPVGDSVATTIVESINTSKRTILLLSPSFLENEWRSLEFQAAHAQTLRDKRNRIIIVIVEEFSKDMTGEDLRLYMSASRCLKMTDPLFWDKLYFALPKKVKVQSRNSEQLLADQEFELNA
ncbi:toll-like receptor Tollo [Acanthaster planci]|uniref:Toll-like receptor Tollo n=1 Tax=Acanthaster planci TaxID=133434 RepID=A0A8B7YD03_ACAPL|nr:toll-like receptor Tollo [Acanthaster planci]